MKKYKPEDLKGKFVIGFDTICEGNQCGKDENDNPDPNLYDSYDEAFKELFIDASCGVEGNVEHLEDEQARDKMLAEMNALIKEDDIEKMKAYMSENPDSNYYEEFIEKAEDFVVGRKAIVTDKGLKIEGVKLEDLEDE